MDERYEGDSRAGPGLLAAWRHGVRWWIARYGLAEVGGLAGSLLASSVAQRSTGSELLAAYAASFAETACYYTIILGRELSQARADGEAGPSPLSRLRRLLIEFGPAELLDVLLLRPAALGACTRALGRDLGVPLGKLLADVVFYGAVIVAYRTQRRTSRG